jgi:hypothetical protein
MLGELLDQNRPRLLAKPYKSRPEIKKKPERATRSFSMREGSVDLDPDDFSEEAPADS